MRPNRTRITGRPSLPGASTKDLGGQRTPTKAQQTTNALPPTMPPLVAWLLGVVGMVVSGVGLAFVPGPIWVSVPWSQVDRSIAVVIADSGAPGEPAKSPDEPTAPIITKGLVPAVYVRIAPGGYQMGSPAAEAGRNEDETRHSVYISGAFELQATEVTQGQWHALMGDTPSGFPGCGADCPVENVSWYESVAYCNALSLAAGLPRCYADADDTDYDRTDANSQRQAVLRFGPLGCTGYRLPTESEWEYAARAGTATASYGGPVGDADCGLDPSLATVAWYCGNAGETTHPVAAKLPNAWGLHDMLGNVWEWTQDVYGEYPAGASADPRGRAAGDYRVVRGGSWSNLARNPRAALRDRDDPGSRYNGLGFRPARSLP